MPIPSRSLEGQNGVHFSCQQCWFELLARRLLSKFSKSFANKPRNLILSLHVRNVSRTSEVTHVIVAVFRISSALWRTSPSGCSMPNFVRVCLRLTEACWQSWSHPGVLGNETTFAGDRDALITIVRGDRDQSNPGFAAVRHLDTWRCAKVQTRHKKDPFITSAYQSKPNKHTHTEITGPWFTH